LLFIDAHPSFSNSQIILQGGENGASPTLQSLIQSAQQTSPHPCRLEVIQQIEAFPNSTATDADIRRRMQRKKSQIQPWDVQETLEEIHRRKYYSAASKKHQQEPQDGQSSVSRWPHVLRAAVEGNAELALSSFGAALFYLQRNLIDAEILSMQKVKAYIPPTSSVVADESVNEIRRIAEEQNRQDSAIAGDEGGTGNAGAALSQALTDSTQSVAFNEGDINHLALDGTTVRNLELLYNTADNKVNGSLWSKIDHTVTPSGRRLLRAWLLRPLFRKADIDRRADAVEELASGAAAIAADKARSVLSKCGDIERLLSRVHTMSGTGEATPDDEEGGPRIHPNDRAILYEMSTYTKVRPDGQ
jgi:DNA mismatch repair protein MSH6